jgi:hypothetical protein
MTTVYLVSYYSGKNFIRRVLIGLITISICFNCYHIASGIRQVNPFPYIVGKENREAFLERNISSYGMFRYINTHLPDTANLFFIYMKNIGYLCNRSYYSDAMFEAHTIQKILRRSSAPETVYDAFKEKGFTHILYDARYITGNLGPFTDREKDLFKAFQNRFLERVKTEKGTYFLFRIIKS